jgi:predicted nucleic acid-binding protein
MKRYVFDSYALLAFLEDEKGAGLVEKALQEVVAHKARGLLSVITWGEIYYSIMREQGQGEAETVLAHVSSYPLELVEVDLDLARAAARLKGRYPVAYADCFAAALAKKYKAVVLTGDPEFKLLENEVKVKWIT